MGFDCVCIVKRCRERTWKSVSSCEDDPMNPMVKGSYLRQALA